MLDPPAYKRDPPSDTEEASEDVFGSTWCPKRGRIGINSLVKAGVDEVLGESKDDDSSEEEDLSGVPAQYVAIASVRGTRSGKAAQTYIVRLRH